MTNLKLINHSRINNRDAIIIKQIIRGVTYKHELPISEFLKFIKSALIIDSPIPPTPSGGRVDTIIGGTNTNIDDSDPVNPIINVTIPSIIFPLEEEGLGTAVYNPAMSGAEEIDLSSFSTYYGILTGTTTLSFINPPPNKRTFVRSVKIKSTTTEGLIMPTTNWHYIGEFVPDGSLYDFQIECTVFPVIGEFYTCYINKLT